MAEQFKGSERDQWLKAIGLKKELAATLRSLPVKDSKKTFEHLPQWIDLEAMHMNLKAKQLRETAGQVSDDKLANILENKADKIEMKARHLEKALALTKEMGMKGYAPMHHKRPAAEMMEDEDYGYETRHEYMPMHHHGPSCQRG